MLIDYIDECGAYVRKSSIKSHLTPSGENKIKYTLSQMQEANMTILTINLRKIHVGILKYIAPYFNLDISKITPNTKSDCDSEHSDD
jgi:hypothetical protein